MSSARRVVARIVPGSVKRRLREEISRSRYRRALRRNFAYDRERFLRHSAPPEVAGVSLQAHLTIYYHMVEKALSLPQPRPGFGKAAMSTLRDLLKRYAREAGRDATSIAGLTALRSYRDFNQQHGIEDPTLQQDIDEVDKLIHTNGSASRSAADCADASDASTIPVTREQIHKGAVRDLSEFFATRHSVRNFSGEPVEREMIERAVRMAQKTPSVCNRQGWRVHVWSDPEGKAKVLGYQNGNRGFGDRAAHVLVVTSDLRYFVSAAERYQAWIDGGMFSMSLIYALHSMGLGTCALNWSTEMERDAEFRAATPQVGDHEIVIMMIAVGRLAESFRVARSPRRPTEQMLDFH